MHAGASIINKFCGVQQPSLGPVSIVHVVDPSHENAIACVHIDNEQIK